MVQVTLTFLVFPPPPLLLWAPHTGPRVAWTAIPGRPWDATSVWQPGQIPTGIHVIPLASAWEHAEDKATLVFVLQWTKAGKLHKLLPRIIWGTSTVKNLHYLSFQGDWLLFFPPLSNWKSTRLSTCISLLPNLGTSWVKTSLQE